MRLLGGVAVAVRCPSATERDFLMRGYSDLDFVGHERQSKAIKDFFLEQGYKPRLRFNAMMGGTRLIFNDLVNQRRVDVFLDVFEMSHKLNFLERLELEPLTLPLADLVATKLQVVQIDEKDYKDLIALFLDHDVGHAGGEMIDGRHLAMLCSSDWGLNRTLTINLSKLSEAVGDYRLNASERELITSRIRDLVDMMEKQPKSVAWKLRARVGEKKRWYELPEADKRVVVDD